MKLKQILMDIFPFLFSAISRFFESLPQPAKDALIQAGKFSQILKHEYSNGYDSFVQVVSLNLGLTKEQTDELLMSLAKKMSINIDAPKELFDRLQSIIDAGLEDSAWDNLWHSIAGQLSIILSGGRFDWGALAMGVIQFVY